MLRFALLASMAWLIVLALRPVVGSSLDEAAWLATLPLLACVVSSALYFGAAYFLSPYRGGG